MTIESFFGNVWVGIFLITWILCGTMGWYGCMIQEAVTGRELLSSRGWFFATVLSGPFIWCVHLLMGSGRGIYYLLKKL